MVATHRRMYRVHQLLKVVLCMAMCTTTLSAQQLQTRDFQAQSENGEVPVIILLKSNPKASQERGNEGGWLNLQDYISQVQQEFTKEQGWVNFNELVKFKHVPAVAKSVSASELKQIQQSNFVEGVYEDKFNSPSLVNSYELIGLSHIPNFSYKGKGYAVAIVDSGVESSHPFLQNRVLDGACFSFNNSCPGNQKRAFGVDAGQPCIGNTGCFHGTHVAGIVAGAQAEFTGVAPQANLLAVNVFSVAGQRMGSRDSDIMQALEWVYDNAEKHNIAAVNMSLGGGRFTQTCNDSPIKRFVDLLAEKEVVTVVAAGNEGFTDAVASPACITEVLTVGAIDPVGRISNYSNSYSALDLVAPGSEIKSSGLNGRYVVSSGTSMAAPQVAGAIALLRSAFPNATAEQLSRAVKRGKPFSDPRNGLQTVSLFVPAAIQYLEKQGTAPPPDSRQSPPPNKQPVCETRVDGIIIEDTTEDCQTNGDNFQW